MAIKELPQGEGARFFKPDDFEGAVAMLVEVRNFKRQVPGGNFGPKDTAYCDITAFATDEELNAGKPSITVKNTAIQQTALAPDLEDIVGDAVIVTLGKSTPKNANKKPAWIWKTVSLDAKNKVAKFYDEREAAIAAAVADAPGFDD